MFLGAGEEPGITTTSLIQDHAPMLFMPNSHSHHPAEMQLIKPGNIFLLLPNFGEPLQIVDSVSCS